MLGKNDKQQTNQPQPLICENRAQIAPEYIHIPMNTFEVWREVTEIVCLTHNETSSPRNYSVHKLSPTSGAKRNV